MYWPSHISQKRPLLLLGWDPIEGMDVEHDAQALVSAYQQVAPRPWAEIAMVVGDLSSQNMDIYAAACDRACVPLVLQVRTWPGEWLPQSRQWTVPVGEWSDLALRHPSVVGAQVVELNCFGFSTEERLYVRHLMQACAAQEKFLSWQEANDGTNIWLDVGLDREFFADLCRYGAYILPQWEMNIARSMYLCQASVWGMWLSQAVDHWGVEAQSWYWHTCGYTKLNTMDERFDQGYRQGDRTAFPNTMWGQMLLLGASAGATVYSIEPTRDVVWTKDPATPLARTYLDVIEPFFTQLAVVGIPGLQEVLAKVQVAYHADFSSEYDAQASDVDYFRARTTDSWRHGRQLHRGSGSGTWWKGSYGIGDERDMIPNTGRYYWLPVLPKFTEPDQLRAYPTLITPNTFASESEVREFLDARYPIGSVRGQGFWAEFATSWFLCHSVENTDVLQTVILGDLNDEVIARLEVTWGPHAFALIHRTKGLWHLYQQGRADRVATWRLTTRQPCRLEVDAGCSGWLEWQGQRISDQAPRVLAAGDHGLTVYPPMALTIHAEKVRGIQETVGDFGEEGEG